MKGTLGIVLMITSPFLVGGLVLLVLKLQEIYAQHKYAHAVEVRNAKIAKLGLKPFKGTKQYITEDVDYSTGRDAYRFKRGTHR